MWKAALALMKIEHTIFSSDPNVLLSFSFPWPVTLGQCPEVCGGGEGTLFSVTNCPATDHWPATCGVSSEQDQMSVTIASWWHLDTTREINPKCSNFPLPGAGKIISHVISHAKECLDDYLPNFQQIKSYWVTFLTFIFRIRIMIF